MVDTVREINIEFTQGDTPDVIKAYFLNPDGSPIKIGGATITFGAYRGRNDARDGIKPVILYSYVAPLNQISDAGIAEIVIPYTHTNIRAYNNYYYEIQGIIPGADIEIVKTPQRGRLRVLRQLITDTSVSNEVIAPAASSYQILNDGSTQLSWPPSPNADGGYNVYINNNPPIHTDSNDYVIKNIDPTVTLSVSVSAIDSSAVESPKSAVMTVLPRGYIRFDKTVHVVNSTDKIASVRIVREGGNIGGITGTVTWEGGKYVSAGQAQISFGQGVGGAQLIAIPIANVPGSSTDETINLALSGTSVGSTLITATLTISGSGVVQVEPTLTLNGSAELTLIQNSSYTDAGAVFVNSAGETSTILADTPPDLTVLGLQTTTYTARDDAVGITLTATRAILVNQAEEPPPVVDLTPVISTVGETKTGELTFDFLVVASNTPDGVLVTDQPAADGSEAGWTTGGGVITSFTLADYGDYTLYVFAKNSIGISESYSVSGTVDAPAASEVGFAQAQYAIADTKTLDIILHRSGTATTSLSVDVSVDPSSASKLGVNFDYTPETVVWPVGDFADKTITLTNITAPDGAISLLINAAVATGAETMTIGQVQVSVAKDTPATVADTVTFSPDSYSIQDVTTHDITLKRQGASTAPLIAKVVVDQASLFFVGTYFDFTPTEVTWDAGDFSDKTVTLTNVSAADRSRNLLFNLSVVSGTETVLVNTLHIFLAQNTATGGGTPDIPDTLGFVNASYNIKDQATLDIPIHRSGDLTTPLTASVSVDPASTPKLGVNFDYTPNPIVWAAGDYADKSIQLTNINAPNGGRNVLLNLAIVSGTETLLTKQVLVHISADTVTGAGTGGGTVIPSNDVQVYPMSAALQEEFQRQPLYIVSVKPFGSANTEYVDSPVFEDKVPQSAGSHRTPFMLKNLSFTKFSFAGKITIRITKVGGGSMTNPQIMPKWWQVPITGGGTNEVTFDLDMDNNQYGTKKIDGTRNPIDGMQFFFVDDETKSVKTTSIQAKSSTKVVYDHPLQISALPIDQQAPDPNAANVQVVNPGDPVSSYGTLFNRTNSFGLAYKEVVVNLPSGKDTLYFKSGLHLSEYLTTKNNQNIYIAGGAVLRASISVNNNPSNWSVKGRGYLTAFGEGWDTIRSGRTIQGLPDNNNSPDGSKHPFGPSLIQVGGGSAVNCEIEGIGCIWPNDSNIVSDPPVKIKNVLLTGWFNQSDGITIGENADVDNLCILSHDDCMKLYNSNASVTNTVIWQQVTGGPFKLAWRGIGFDVGCHVNNYTLVHSAVVDDKLRDAVAGVTQDHPELGGTAAVICSQAYGQEGGSKGGGSKDFILEDVHIESPDLLKAIMIRFVTRHTAPTPLDGGGGVNYWWGNRNVNALKEVSGFLMKDWTFEGTPYCESSIYANYGSVCKNMTFENFVFGAVNGQGGKAVASKDYFPALRSQNGKSLTRTNRLLLVKGTTGNNVISNIKFKLSGKASGGLTTELLDTGKLHDFPNSRLVGGVIKNLTKSTTATITSSTAVRIRHTAMTAWGPGDKYEVIAP